MHNKNSRFVFFGTPEIAVFVLEELADANFLPSLIVTNPDAPKGRKLVLSPSPVKEWAITHSIPTLQPETLTDDTVCEILKKEASAFFVVAAYGKIIPKNILEIPTYGTLNVHPSLLPRFRGASPIRSAILKDERTTGVTIMLMDEKLDHGPILAQERVTIESPAWPIRGSELDELLARKGGVLLAHTIPEWLSGTISAHEQDHDSATFCTKICKGMGEIDLSKDPYENLLKIRAYDGWPGTYFFREHKGKRVRVKICDATLDSDGSLLITRVIPENKNEMSYNEFLRM